MHDFSTLGRDIAELIARRAVTSRIGGDIGDSGDGQHKRLISREKSATTRFNNVSPLKYEWGQPPQTSGDKKSQPNESLAGSVPTATTVPTTLRQHSAIDVGEKKATHQTHIPQSWRDGFRILRAAKPLDDFHPDAWSAMVHDAQTFLAIWGQQIARFGWRDVDVFGLNPHAPCARVGCWGLTFLIQSGTVGAVTDTSAVIRRPSGAALTWRRCDGPQRPAWEFVDV